MLHGSVDTHAVRQRRRMELERWRMRDQLRTETMFVSYVFHEMRNPYNGISGHLACVDETVTQLTASLRDAGITDLAAAGAGGSGGGGGGGAAARGGGGKAPKGGAAIAHQLQNIHDDLANVQLCSLHMNDILNNVLDIKKLEEGKMLMQPSVVDLAQLARDVVSMVASRSADVDMRVATAVERGGARGDAPRVRERAASADAALAPCAIHAAHAKGRGLLVIADKVRLRQVLLNLIGNALKHTNSGNVEARLTELTGAAASGRLGAARAGPASGPVEDVTVRFEVSDTGPGIAPEMQKHLFNKFETLQALSLIHI